MSLIEQCWSTDPSARPSFDIVAQGLGYLVGGLARSKSPSPQSKILNAIRREERFRSPDMAPIDLPDVSRKWLFQYLRWVTWVTSSRYAAEALGQDAMTLDAPVLKHSPELGHVSVPSTSIPVQRVVTPSLDDPTVPGGPRGPGGPAQEISQEYDEKLEHLIDPDTPSMFTDSQEGELEDLWDGYESPPPRDAHIAARRDERRYRLLLQHDFHPSCELIRRRGGSRRVAYRVRTVNLPLWEPSPVRLGAVGYLSKPSGRFVSLFNSFNPSGTPDARVHGLPSIYGYGAVREAATRLDRRNIAQIGIDMIQGLLTFKKGSGMDTLFS